MTSHLPFQAVIVTKSGELHLSRQGITSTGHCTCEAQAAAWQQEGPLAEQQARVHAGTGCGVLGQAAGHQHGRPAWQSRPTVLSVRLTSVTMIMCCSSAICSMHWEGLLQAALHPPASHRAGRADRRLGQPRQGVPVAQRGAIWQPRHELVLPHQLLQVDAALRGPRHAAPRTAPTLSPCLERAQTPGCPPPAPPCKTRRQ